MPDDGFRDAFRLPDRGTQLLLQQVERQVAAVELEGHERGREVLVRGADVVEEAGEEVGLVGDGEGVRGGEVRLDRFAWKMGAIVSDRRPWSVVMLSGGGVGFTVVVDAHAVVECLLSELLLRVIEHGFRERGAGEGDAGDCLRFWRFEVLLVAEEG